MTVDKLAAAAHAAGDCGYRCPLCSDDLDEFAAHHARDAAVAHAIASCPAAAALATAIATDTGRTAP